MYVDSSSSSFTLSSTESVLFIGTEFSILYTSVYPPAGPLVRVLGVCGRVYVCTQAIIGFLAFELLVNNASSATLAFSLRLVSFLPAADAPATRVGFSAAPPLAPPPLHGSSSSTLPPHLDLHYVHLQ